MLFLGVMLVYDCTTPLQAIIIIVSVLTTILIADISSDFICIAIAMCCPDQITPQVRY
jgi:hypothetical protein